MAFVETETCRSTFAATKGPRRAPSLLGKIITGMRQGLAAADALSRREDVAGACVARQCRGDAFRERYFG